jgi:hypothetical protein
MTQLQDIENLIGGMIAKQPALDFAFLAAKRAPHLDVV